MQLVAPSNRAVVCWSVHQRPSPCHRHVHGSIAPLKSAVHRSARQPLGGRYSLRAQAVDQGAGLQPELRSAIDTFISENRVIVFMKGTKEMPMCGFSNTVVQILNTVNAPFVSVNILEDELLRSGMKEYSQWPTFPQVYISGEFFGGCDIMIASYQSGELAEVLEAALNS